MSENVRGRMQGGEMGVLLFGGRWEQIQSACLQPRVIINFIKSRWWYL